MRNVWSLLVAIGIACLCGTAYAHGGYYQGPKTPDGVPLPPSGAGTPSGRGSTTPDSLDSGGPAVTGRKKPPREVSPSTESLPPGISEPPIRGTQWEHWWSLNKSRYLALAFTRNRRHAVQNTAEGPGSPAITAADLNTYGTFFEARLGDPSSEVRASAAVALGRLRVTSARKALLERARDDDSPDVRAMSLVAIAMMPSEMSLPALAELLSDPKRPAETRSLAALAVGRIEGPDAVAVLRQLIPPKNGRSRLAPVIQASVYFALGLTGDAGAAKLLRDRVNNPKAGHAVVRSFAALALGRLNDRESIDLLRALLTKNGNVSMRRSAGLALGRMAQPSDVKAIRDLLAMSSSSRDPGLRRTCTLALGRIDSPHVRTSLASRFRSAKPIDRPFTAIALALQGDPSAAALLRKGLVEDEFEESLQAAYAVALGMLGDTESDALLTKEVGKPHRVWSPGYAALGLGMAARKDTADALFARIGKTSDPKAQGNLIVGLGLLADPRAAKLLNDRLGPKRTIYERATAALACGWVRFSPAAPRLLEMATGAMGEPPILRAAAISGLSRLAAVDGDAPLLDLLDGHNVSIELDSLKRVAEALNER